MIDTFTPEHHIQQHILRVLMIHKSARFKDMRPKNCETNLYSYHLKLLQKHGFVSKNDDGYTLAITGLLYADRLSSKTRHLRTQPKIISMLVIRNSLDKLLLYKRDHQPYADVWTLPYGKMHIDDASVHEAAIREAYEKLSISDINLEHAGECYIRIKNDDEILMSTLVHVFRGSKEEIPPSHKIVWADMNKLSDMQLAPAVKEIASRTINSESHFFDEYTFEWEG